MPKRSVAQRSIILRKRKDVCVSRVKRTARTGVLRRPLAGVVLPVVISWCRLLGIKLMPLHSSYFFITSGNGNLQSRGSHLREKCSGFSSKQCMSSWMVTAQNYGTFSRLMLLTKGESLKDLLNNPPYMEFPPSTSPASPLMHPLTGAPAFSLHFIRRSHRPIVIYFGKRAHRLIVIFFDKHSHQFTDIDFDGFNCLLGCPLDVFISTISSSNSPFGDVCLLDCPSLSSSHQTIPLCHENMRYIVGFI